MVFPPRTIIQHRSINMTVPNDVPESLEYHFDAKTVLLFFCSRQGPHRNHLTDFSELLHRRFHRERYGPVNASGASVVSVGSFGVTMS